MEAGTSRLLACRKKARAALRRRSRCLWLLCVLLPLPAVARPEQAPSPQELLRQLNEVSVDPNQIYFVRDVHLARDRVQVYFNHGFVGLLRKVAGEVTGAVFAGEGEVLVMPPSLAEKRNLAQFIGSPILEERFAFAYLRFTDRTAEELLTVGRKPEPDDPEQPTGFLEYWNPAVNRLSPEYSARILADLLGDRGYPFFHVQIHGADLGVFGVVVDERHPEAVRIVGTRRSRGRLHGDVWCSFPSRLSEARAASLQMGPALVRSYRIETRISPDNSLEGHAQLELESQSGVDRVLAFELSRWLRVQSVKDEQGQTPIVFQNPSLEESEMAARGNDWIVIVMPSARPVGEHFRLDFTYQGNVIAEVGNGVLYVGARGSWYPNRGWSASATYDLTFHYPERFTLVATGTRVEETVAGGVKHSRWVSDGEFSVAGFNMGAYESSTRRVGNTTIEVYAARQAEEALEKRRAAANPPVDVVVSQVGRGPIGIVQRPSIPLAPSALLESVAQTAARAVGYFETLFGPFPFPRLAIAQVPGNFGQGWPELVYLPTLSFLPTSQREEVGLREKSDELQSQVVVAHEIAHQWWGNLVGWQTYRDQWLSEGFASYAAALFLAQEKDGERKFRELLRSYKRDLLRKTPEGETVESGGPIWLGERLSNSLNPGGYSSIVYKKACWVLHMLREIMRDPKTGSDEKFFKMLCDFVVAYTGRRASTGDFIRHAEKYMTRAMDLERNRRLDWFFDQWVFGIGIPTYRLESKTRRLGPSKYVVQGTITQSDAPPGFEMLVPIVASYGRDRQVTLGRVAVDEAGAHFRFTTSANPSRVAIDEENLLAVIRD